MTATTSANATLTRAQVESILIQPLAQTSQFLRLGTPMYVSDGSPIKLPTLTSFGTANGFVAEGSAIPEASATTSEVELLASTIYAVKTMAKVSNSLLRQSVPNVESAFSVALVGEVARILDSAMFQGGTATTGSPIGLANITGFSNAGTAASTAITSGLLVDMWEKYLTVYGDENEAQWVMSPATFTFIRKLSDSYGQAVLQPSLAAGAPKQFWSALHSDNSLPLDVAPAFRPVEDRGGHG